MAADHLALTNETLTNELPLTNETLTNEPLTNETVTNEPASSVKSAEVTPTGGDMPVEVKPSDVEMTRTTSEVDDQLKTVFSSSGETWRF